MVNKFYYCEVCGNVLVAVVPSGVDPVCCDVPMVELVPNTEDGVIESHMPVVTCKEKDVVVVRIGSKDHPMVDDHYICFVAVETKRGISIKYLEPGEEPEARFCCIEEPVAVYAYCNKHGFWKKCCAKSSCNKQNL